MVGEVCDLFEREVEYTESVPKQTLNDPNTRLWLLASMWMVFLPKILRPKIRF
jgi:hypothetical protein